MPPMQYDADRWKSLKRGVAEMHKVLIVDDEKEIREGLKTVFPWAECGVAEVHTAEDGEKALLLVERLDPDVIVTDIKMNRMSGLDLIDKLQEKGRFTGKTIVISGYDDFDLVKQAMKLGATDYILKPIQIAELKQVVLRAIAEIREERALEHNQRMLENQLRQAVPRLKEEVLRELIDRAPDPYGATRIKHRLKTLDLEWMLEDRMVLMVAEVDDAAALEQNKRYKREKELISFAIGNVAEMVVREECGYTAELFQDREERWVIAIGRRPHAEQSAYSELAKLLIDKINANVKVNVTIALTSTVGEWNRLLDLYREAIDTLELKALYGGNQLLIADEKENDSIDLEVSLSNVHEVLDLIKYGSESDIREAMSAFPVFVRAWSLSSLREIQGRLFDWLFGLVKEASAAGCKDPWWEGNLLAIWDQIEQFDTLESLQNQMTAYLLRLAGGFDQRKPSQNLILTEAEKYIQAHYRDNLTLQTVARQICVTPVWLSKLFKKEKQITFLEYLTRVRIEHAKIRLADARFRIYQVGLEVGYGNPEHFTKTFKKAVGCTPKEYRNQRGIADE